MAGLSGRRRAILEKFSKLPKFPLVAGTLPAVQNGMIHSLARLSRSRPWRPATLDRQECACGGEWTGMDYFRGTKEFGTVMQCTRLHAIRIHIQERRTIRCLLGAIVCGVLWPCGFQLRKQRM